MRLTEAAIIEELVRKSGGAVGPAVHLGDRWEAPLRGGTSRLVYYLNTLDTDLVRDPPAWLPTVRTLFVAGFNPCPELVRALPNLRCAISTYMCKYAPPGQLSPWYRALPEGTAWRPLMQPDFVWPRGIEHGVWYHHLWVNADKDKYPITEMPNVWYVSDEEEEEEEEEVLEDCVSCGAPAKFYLSPCRDIECGCGTSWRRPFTSCELKCPDSIWEVAEPRQLKDGVRVASVAVEDECNGCGFALFFDADFRVENIDKPKPT